MRYAWEVIYITYTHRLHTTAIMATGSVHTAHTYVVHSHLAHGDIAHVHKGVPEVHRPAETDMCSLVQVLQSTTQTRMRICR